jgi:hypothetical protein
LIVVMGKECTEHQLSVISFDICAAFLGARPSFCFMPMLSLIVSNLSFISRQN